MKRPAWVKLPGLPGLGWAWLFLGALVAAGASWQTRYSPLYVRNLDDGSTITYVWDRWIHRACGHFVGTVGEEPDEHQLRVLRCWETDQYDPEWFDSAAEEASDFPNDTMMMGADFPPDRSN
jgi:hypothetical protein